MSKSWINIGGGCYFMDDGVKVDIVNSVYTIKFDGNRGMFFLSEFGKTFNLPSKIYDIDRDFINRCKKSWEHCNGNMGVLLTGIKGTGKTITGKLLAQELNLPIILITQYIDGIEGFISELNFDCIIFCDEFEKVWSQEEQNALLTLMDGVKTSNYKKMFILTSNSMYVNEYLIDRPSRVRYIKEYKTLTPKVLMEIIKNEMNNPDFIQDALHAFSKIQFLTIDVVIQMLKESNIHDQPVSSFVDVFNATKRIVKNIVDVVNAETNELIYQIVADEEEDYTQEDSVEIGDFVYDTMKTVVVCKVTDIIDKNKYAVKMAIPYTISGKQVDYYTAATYASEKSFKAGLLACGDLMIQKEFDQFANIHRIYRNDRYSSEAKGKEKKFNWVIEDRIISLNRPERVSHAISNLVNKDSDNVPFAPTSI